MKSPPSLTSLLRQDEPDALVSSRLDLQEMHLRRERLYKKAQKAARQKRVTVILDEALHIIDEGW
jgi:hypothetical protein